jgi:hypothetical protein
MPTTDHDPIDFTFADDGNLVRKAPKAVPEDPVEKRLQREWEAAPFIAEATEAHRPVGMTDLQYIRAIEVKYGSGKVKV